MENEYFQHFNYSLANEDLRVEKEIALKHKTIAAVCGSGLRALNLIHPELKEMTIFDISKTQLSYAQFQYASIQELTYFEYLELFGLTPCSEQRKSDLLLRIAKRWPENDFAKYTTKKMLKKGIAYSGRWESFVVKISKLVRFFLNFNFDKKIYSLSDENRISTKKLPLQRLRFLIGLIAHPALVNRLLYKGKMAKNSGFQLRDLIFDGIVSTLASVEIKSSYLHQLFFLEEIKYPEGVESIMSEGQFEQIKKYTGRVTFRHDNLVDIINKIDCEFWSCSDVVSYLDAEKSEALSEKMFFTQGKTFIYRSFLRHGNLGAKIQKFRNPDLEKWAKEKDLTKLYEFQIYQT